MAEITANGVRLEYDVTGPEDGAPILLIMGFGTQMTAWPDEFRQMLVDAGLKVIRFDNRDVGLSQKWDGVLPDVKAAQKAAYDGKTPDVPYSLDDMAADAAALLDELGIESAHIAGASMGGMIAQLVALNHPAKARSLISIYSTTGDPSLPRSTPEAQAALTSAPPSQSREDVIAHSLKNRRAYASTRFVYDEERLARLIGDAYDRSFYPEGTLRHWAAIVTAPPRTDCLKQLRIPALVLHGSSDTLIPPQAGRHTAAQIHGAEHHEIEGWGHDMPVGVIPELHDVIVPFVARVEEMREDGFAIPAQPGCCGVNPQ
jgi:pimeloyl-ACP methyl ester carboxylesterase